MLFTTLTTTTILLATAALATPINQNLSPRAGGPAAKPIPSTCTLTSPLPTTYTTLQPKLSTNTSALVYSYFLSGTTANFTECYEQCYGFGTPGTCVSAFMANKALTPIGYFGTPGGAQETGCLMFNRTLSATDFEQPEVDGTYEDVQIVNIGCADATTTGTEGKEGRSGTVPSS